MALQCSLAVGRQCSSAEPVFPVVKLWLPTYLQDEAAVLLLGFVGADTLGNRFDPGSVIQTSVQICPSPCKLFSRCVAILLKQAVLISLQQVPSMQDVHGVGHGSGGQLAFSHHRAAFSCG